MTFALRDYQEDMIARTRVSLRTNRAVLVVAPTGSGKTNLAGYMAKTAAGKGKSVWFLCAKDFLISQTSNTFAAVGIPHSFIAAGRYHDPSEPVQIVSVQTLQRRLARFLPPDLLIWDEAHHVAAKGWRAVYDWAIGARHIGLSATPCRLDGKGLRSAFDDMVTGPSTRELIEDGYLSNYRAYAPTTPNIDGLHVRAGDYARDELQGLMDDNEIIGDLVRHYRERAGGLRAVYFAVSVRHSQHIAATFNASGIAAVHLDGDHSTEERLASGHAFADGRVKVITNCDLFGEGFDLASQVGRDVSIECVGLARPTKSLALHLQQIGRALRPKQGPAIILDHAGNLLRHGLPDQPREWSLDGLDRSRAKAVSGPPVRQCMGCFAVFVASARACPECGMVPEYAGRTIEEVEGELAEVRRVEMEEAKKVERRQVGMAKTLDDLMDVARQRGYKSPHTWAVKVIEWREKKAREKVEAQAQAYLHV